MKQAGKKSHLESTVQKIVGGPSGRLQDILSALSPPGRSRSLPSSRSGRCPASFPTFSPSRPGHILAHVGCRSASPSNGPRRRRNEHVDGSKERWCAIRPHRGLWIIDMQSTAGTPEPDDVISGAEVARLAPRSGLRRDRLEDRSRRADADQTYSDPHAQHPLRTGQSAQCQPTRGGKTPASTAARISAVSR